MKLICILTAALLLNVCRAATNDTNLITFTTLNGVTWSNAHLVKVEANRIMVTEGTRGARVHYTNLPDDVLAVLGFDLDVAAAADVAENTRAMHQQALDRERMQKAIIYERGHSASSRVQAEADFAAAMAFKNSVTNADKTERFLIQSANGLNTAAMIELVKYYLEPRHKDVASAHRWAEQAARLANGDGYYFLALGSPVTNGRATAALYLERGAGVGSLRCARELGRRYENGSNGVQRDLKRAAEYYEMGEAFAELAELSKDAPLRAYSWRRVYEMLTAPYTKAFTSTSIALTDQEMLQANEWARDYIARRKLIPRTARNDD